MSREERHGQDKGAILFIEGGRAWPTELLRLTAHQGYANVHVDDTEHVRSLVRSGGVVAVVVDVRSLGMLDVLALRKCREDSPSMALVVTAATAAPSDIKRALDSGATAFVSWPAPAEVILAALGSASGGDALREERTRTRPFEPPDRTPATVFTREEKRRLREQVFRKANLDGVDFSSADLRGSIFDEVSLRGSNFMGADLRRAQFLKCDLRGARLLDVLLDESGFHGSCLANATGLTEAQIDYARRRGGVFVG
ncbi:MAG: pentapeptide repeat-containing protein [Deltaproteobacteria bacterium]|nr:pentapeptide repeat-containing protein [Deltaproteobacteria bacterium]